VRVKADIEGATEAERKEALELTNRKFVKYMSAFLYGDFESIPGASLLPTADLEKQLAPLRDDIRDWWRSLPPAEARKLAGGLDRSRYKRVDVTLDFGAEDPFAELNRQVADDELFAYFVIGTDPVQDGEGCKYVSRNVTDDNLRNWFERHATAEVRERRLEHEAIDKETAEWIQQRLEFAEKQISEEGEEEEVSQQDRIREFAPMVFAYLLWMSVFTIAQMLLTNTIEEKSNRIIEVLLSSVSPLQLMAGKILGIAWTGLTMIVSWVLSFLVIIKFLPGILGLDLDVDLSFILTDPTLLTSFIVYFILGYLFLASMLVAIGSACDSLKEAQNLMGPVTMIMMIPLLAIVFITQDPNGALARVLSYIPPFTPFVMMNRAGGPPPTHEYVTTTLLLLVSLIVMFWGAAKIFRVGILMTGKAPTPMEILRWLRYPVGQIPVRDTPEDDTEDTLAKKDTP